MRKSSLLTKALFTLLGSLFGLAFFWLVIMKIISRIAARYGISGPCPSALSWIVDNPMRQRQVPLILDRAGIQPGERVLELGPGPGAFTIDAARRTGEKGSIVAIDIQPQMIAKVELRAYHAGVENVETHVASAYDMPLPDASIDRAFLVTVLPEIPDQGRALQELQRVLKPGATLSITEQFPDPDYPFAFETIRRVEAEGFRLVRHFGNTWNYTLNFEKVAALEPGILEVMACPHCHANLAYEAANASLFCNACQQEYPVRQGITHFLQPGELTGENRRFARMYDWFSWLYRPFSKVAFAFLGMSEEQGRREILDCLDPHGGRVLEVSIGPGVNLPYLVGRSDVGEIFGLDISLGQLQRCREFIIRKGWPVQLFRGNGEELPFQDNSFDGVFHIGGINFFNDKQKAITEMIRVAKPGARILISDETEKGARGYELTIPGFKQSFEGKREKIVAPVHLIPAEMREVRVFDVWKGWLYCIEFRKPGVDHHATKD